MKYKVEIDIMPLKALLDPQGKAVTSSLKNLGFSEIDNVRIGKQITLAVEAANKEEDTNRVEMACKKLLANEIMESNEFTINNVPADR